MSKKRKTKNRNSILFILWATFSVFSLIIVLAFGIAQSALFKDTYRTTLASDVARNGKTLIRELGGLPHASSEYDRYIRAKSYEYDMNVFLLNPDGSVKYPSSSENGDLYVDFSTYMPEIIKELDKSSKGEILFEIKRVGIAYVTKYVYNDGVEMQETYLYVAKSTEFLKNVINEYTVRLVLTAVFAEILAFAVSGIVSGTIVKPITELTEKSKVFASGDFSVDFSDKTYSSEVSALADSLNFAKEEISRADKMQKELIANVSHDFKTPLTMIKAYSSMIREISGDDPVKRNKHAKVIEDEADRLTVLVSDVLDLSKLQSGINAPEITEFDVSEIIISVIDKFKYLEETSGYKFETDIERCSYVRADKKMIEQAIYNLVGNAVNYTGDDKKVFVKLERKDGIARFTVKDTGKGIKSEDIANIWNRYYRSGETHKRPVGGTGLGLSIVKTVLEKHRFVFGVESKEGKGSTFYIDFPLTNA